MTGGGFEAADALRALALLLLIAAAWALAHNRLDPAAWRAPLSYEGDSLYFLAMTRAFSTGELKPVAPKSVAALGAPAGAQWNDYPTVEEPVFFVSGLLARGLGLAAGSSLVVLLAHLLAGLAFYAACRALRYRWAFAFAGAALFANAAYLYRRSLVHLNLTHCWHVPLCVLVILWALSPPGLNGPRRRWAAFAVALVTGSLNPYYSAMFLQLLALAALVRLVRGDRRSLLPFAGVGAAWLLGFLAVSVDTFWFAWRHGPNPAAVVRSIAAIENLSLKPVDLFLPAVHRWEAAVGFLHREYFSQILVRSEVGSAYLGVVGGGALLALIAVSWHRLLRRPVASPPVHAWLVLWVVLYSVVGGVASALGVLGFRYLRAGNRFSVFILALVLLFLVRELSRRCPRRWAAAVATVLLAVGLWDQVPPQTPSARIHALDERFASDRAFTGALERLLPAGGVVFQLPVVAFPEVPNPEAMDSYAHLRPFLFSRTLRFTFGAHKGRGLENWQRAAAAAGAEQMVAELEARGVSALLINRDGYSDRAEGLLAALRAAGREPALSHPQGDLVVLPLSPSGATDADAG